jgi:hypothetical protein
LLDCFFTPDGIIEKSRKARKYGGPYPRRVLMPMGEDEIHVLRAQKKDGLEVPLQIRPSSTTWM